MGDDSLVDLPAGGFIGRHPSAALQLNDPRISEAHALLSLRGRGLRLLALRGRFTVGGSALGEVALCAGLEIQLAPGIAVRVAAVVLPDRVLGLEGPAFPRRMLPPVAALRSADPELVPRFVHDADALLWSAGDATYLRQPGQADVRVAAGDSFTVAGRRYHLVAIALDGADTPPTERADEVDAPLTLVLRYDTVHVHRGARSFPIDGTPARLLTELAQIGVPAEWRTVARLVWPGEDEDTSLRARWDRALARLRKRLAEHGLRPDLVRTDGAGRAEVHLGPRDRVRDET